MSQNVKFFFTSTKSKFDALIEKNPLALYFITDEVTGCNYLYKGDKLISVGHEASEEYAGLMSAADKTKLDKLTIDGGISKLVPADGSIVIKDGEDDTKSIGVAISSQEGNALTLADGGLFVPAAKEISMPEYTIEKQEVAEDGFTVSYKLKKTVDGESTFVGDAINIAKDMVLQSATLETVTEADVPYAGAIVGDPYIDMAFNDATSTHIYVPVKSLVDTYTAGEGIEIVDGKVSVKIADESNGLVAVDGSLSIDLATATSAGAMSAADKAFIDAIPDTYATIARVKDTAVQKKFEITSTPEGTLVNYGEHEIRIMCPANTQWKKQNVGANGLPNRYYVGFKAYAPEDAVSFKEDVKTVIEDQTMWYFENNPTAGIDKYGRKYSIVWISVAEYDEATNKWTYFGANSTTDSCFSKHYAVEWYDANGICIGSDYIRINLTNERCHMVTVPYYMANYATIEQIAKIEESLTWNEIVEF